jgi:SAM-dependent methyltransferase
VHEDTTKYLHRRWAELGAANAVFCRPWFDLDPTTARQRLDPDGELGELRSKQVLCLAGGGGQQSVAFAILGAGVIVLDLDGSQLERDRQAAERLGVAVRTDQGDMRDLSRYRDSCFDVVWQPYSINFVPDFEKIVSEVARVLRPRGTYTVMMANPFASGIGTSDWNGDGYVVRRPYVDGGEYEFQDEDWAHDGTGEIPPPREFRHTLGKVIRVLAAAGFAVFRIDEATSPQADSVPGTWPHLKSVMPPWLTLWARLENVCSQGGPDCDESEGR